MELDSLFMDRKVRKMIRESVYCAEDEGKNICESCGKDSLHTFNVLGKCLCESCSEELLEESNNYDECFESVNDLYLLNEDYIYTLVDLRKLENDANSKFNGSIPDLMRSYGMKVGKAWNTYYNNGVIWVDSTDLTSGKTKVNQFLIDYNAGFRTSKFPSIVPDADGTTYQPRVIPKTDPIRQDSLKVAAVSKWNKQAGGSSGVSSSNSTQTPPVATQAKTNVVPAAPAPTQVPQKTSPTIKNTKTATDVKSKGLKLKGDIDSFSVVVDGADILKVNTTVDASGVRTASVEGTTNQIESIVVGNLSNLKDVAEIILNAVILNPDKFFKSFEGESNEISINSYDFYKFVLDGKSFDGGKFSLAKKFRGKVFSDKRCYLDVQSLVSRTKLISSLEKSLEEKIKEQYPSLFDGKNILKTSLGKVEFDLSDLDNSNNPILSYSIGGNEFSYTVTDRNKFKNEDAKMFFSTIILNNIKNIIVPDWGVYDKHDTGKLVYDYGDDKTGYEIYADFDKNEFLDSGNFVFRCSIIDKLHGIEQPKTQKKVVYNKTTPLPRFLEKVGSDIYREYFKDSDVNDVITASASEKIKNPSKRIALFDKARDIFLSFNKDLRKDLGDLELELSFNVNKSGKLVEAYITISDPYEEVGMDVLSDFVNHKNLKGMVTLYKKDERKYKVIFKVKELKQFADLITFSILESMVFEAFELVSESADGRKTFYM